MTEVTEAALDGPRTLALEPRRSPRAGLSNLLSLNSDAFIRRGLGVLKIDRFSRNLALERGGATVSCNRRERRTRTRIRMRKRIRMSIEVVPSPRSLPSHKGNGNKTPKSSCRLGIP